jgi:uncharacterized protein with NAD-binding domain and iron-sulfur cluster
MKKQRSATQRPLEVAIVGGGCAGITAAFELSRPHHRGKYHVTVYQTGWRLGGKGASGRGAANRIEEHGLHLWMGFYENAFRLMRECYAELGRDPRSCRIADWRDAFVAEPFIGIGGRSGDAKLRQEWLAQFPPGDGLPGDPLADYNPFTITSYLIRSAVLMRTLLTSVAGTNANAARATGFAAAESSAITAAELQATIARYLKFGMLATFTGLIGATRFLELILRGPAAASYPSLLPLIDAIAASLKRQFATIAERDPDLRPVWEIIDLVLAFQRGVLRFDLITDPRGFDCLNDYDTREWLRLNGASEAAVNSGLMRGLYDLAMAYEDGDPERPRMAAGLGLRACLRMFFTYRGALMWKMQAGMGDVVFAPFYQVLKRRGVTFRFFHRLRNLKLSERDGAGQRHVAALEFDVQAAIKDGDEYQPLIDVRGLPCWPSIPDYDQLVDRTRQRAEQWAFESHWEHRKAGTRVLEVAKDFDLVVLGIGLGAIPHVCKEILARDRRWRKMVERVKTVPTQAFQLWLREDMSALGWRDRPTTMSGFGKPFDTWADMRHLIRQEDWRPENLLTRPRSLIYLCGAMREPLPAIDRDGRAYPRFCEAETERAAITWIKEHLGQILPRALKRSGDFRWDLLVAPAGQSIQRKTNDETAFATQFWTANVNPSDRYVISVPGSVEFRISPLDYTYDNLTIAGDWTDCGLNVGCVESAVISGRLAAHAIAGSPALEEIIGYDHP